MSARRGPSVAIALFVAFVAGGCGDAEQVRVAAATCEALSSERFEEALSLSKSGSSASGAGREIAECRCLAFLSLGDRASCTALLSPLLREPAAADWIPHPVLTKLMLRTWQAEGVREPAAALAERAAPALRDDLDLLQLELMLRSSVGDETAVLATLEDRLEDDPSWIPARLVLSLARSRRGEHAEALRVLGDVAPPTTHRLVLPWYESRIQAQAALNDLAGVQATFARWRATGWDSVDLDARYALRLSTDQLVDPEHSTIDLLRRAIATQDALRDRMIVWGLHRRLIVELIAVGRPKEALAAYDAAAQVVDLGDLSRAEIERAVEDPAPEGTAARPAEIVFEIPPGARGGRLALSPEPSDPPDSPYRVLPIPPSGRVTVSLTRGMHPRRWVLHDARGQLRGSGAFWPEPGRALRIAPELRTPGIAESGETDAPDAPARDVARATTTPAVPTRGPGDGRRRVIAILPDCGDWRLVGYLRARGELPFHDHLFDHGYRAVLESRPAFTAAALQSLVWPAAPRVRTTLDWIHDLGLELAGLEAVGSNPLGFLSAVLPERPNLFETLGGSDRIAANMLLAHGQIAAGRHAEVVGPNGHHRDLPTQSAYRPLDAEERRRFPALGVDGEMRRFIETIAAEMDAAERIVREGEIDFLFLRLESLDLITHAVYGALDGRGQDDAAGPLLEAYRYIDLRLARLDALLDRDDWLVYVSDHGIRSSMQHEEDAIFAVLGEGVPPGRAPGRPALRGVPRSLAAMFGVETDWPDTGASPWLEREAEPDRIADAR